MTQLASISNKIPKEDSADFGHRNQNLAIFDLQYQIKSNSFMVVFIDFGNFSSVFIFK